MTPRERIAAICRALAAKTVENGCTEDEAVAAAEKLAKLLQEHNLTLDEAELRASPFADHIHPADDIVGSRLWKPASAIAKMTNTRYWRSQDAGKRGLTFLGLEHEVEIAGYLLAICDRAMRTEAARMTRALALLTPMTRAARMLPFLDGMADRLYERILEMIPPTPTGTGLIVVRAALITEEMARRGIKLENGHARRSLNFGHYQAGKKAGDRVSLNRGLAGGATGRRMIG